MNGFQWTVVIIIEGDTSFIHSYCRIDTPRRYLMELFTVAQHDFTFVHVIILNCDISLSLSLTYLVLPYVDNGTGRYDVAYVVVLLGLP